MNIKKTIFVVALFLSMGLYAHAQGKERIMETGNDLLEGWKAFKTSSGAEDVTRVDSQTYYNAGVFVGFVRGVAKMADVSGLCDIPENATYGQFFRAVGEYLEEHPKELDLGAADLVSKALSKVFPPKK